jgi:hypothetical protein
MMSKSDYEAKYGANNTSMSDADLYGRHAALGVDLDACLRAAVHEVRMGLRGLIGLDRPMKAALRINLARAKWAVVIGNESEAMDSLNRAVEQMGRWDMSKTGHASQQADAAELDRAAAREFAHPGLAERLAETQAAFDAA